MTINEQMKENIASLISQLQEGEFDLATTTVHNLLMDKIVPHLEELQIEIATAHFNGQDHILENEHSGNYDDLSDEAKELHLYADNDQNHHRKEQYIIANLQKKMNKGIYNPELAQKLWRYHADDVRKQYNKQYKTNFKPSHSKEHAAFLEKYHRENSLK
jgi:hypothetical protein